MSMVIGTQDNTGFAGNPEPRCPCVLLLDTSGSMHGAPIAEMARGLAALRDDLVRDPLASRRVEIAIITFGGDVRVAQEFVVAADFDPPMLTAAGQTPLGGAILHGLDMIEGRRALYRRNGIDSFRPWCFLITDGKPEGEPAGVVEDAAARILAAETARHVAFFAVGVRGADMVRLDRVAVRKPVLLDGLRFVDLFLWVSQSVQTVSHSQVGDAVRLPPVGWGAI